MEFPAFTDEELAEMKVSLEGHPSDPERPGRVSILRLIAEVEELRAEVKARHEQYEWLAREYHDVLTRSPV